MATTLTLDASSDPILERRRRIQEVAAASLSRRKAYSKIGIGVCWAFLGIAIIPLVAVVAYVVVKGLPAWNVDFFTHPTYPEGIPGGGVKNAIIGTVVIGVIATVVTVPIGLLCGLFLAESDGPIAGAIRFMADVMTGVPSITIGIFGYIAIVLTTGHYSGLAGAFAIGIIMLPVIMRAGETAIRGVPAISTRRPWPSGPAGPPSPVGWSSPPRCPGSSRGCCWPWPGASARRPRCS